MTATMDYESSIHMVIVGSKKINVHNLTPVFADEEKRSSTKQKIESALYGIFRKYMA